jgi:hypothetical protein
VMRCSIGVASALATVLHPTNYTWRLHSNQRYIPFTSKASVLACTGRETGKEL